ncbi:MAG: acyltransferase family protein, partial [archaeon]|nr:acyltransferase family protein [archaeon]
MNKENSGINYQIKALYLIGIITVLFCHVFTDGGIPGLIYILPLEGFNLAIFIFASGYLYKDKYSNTPLRYILKKFCSLIIPYFILNLIYGGVAQLLHQYGFAFGGDFTLKNIFVQPIIDGHQFIYNLGGWFVFPLFGVMVVNVLLRRIFVKFKYKDYVIFSLFLIIG